MFFIATYFIKYVSASSVFFTVTFIYFTISAEDKTVTSDLIEKKRQADALFWNTF